MMRKLLFCSIIISLLFVTGMVYAQEITLLYTGQTHAMIYHCNCPKEPDGGIARRAALIKSLKANNPNTLVLDAGGFFAGGTLDEYTQNTQLDIQRTKINLAAMGLMGYDAAAISPDEFNFGEKFLLESITQANFQFLSCNIKFEKATPYIIKEIKGLKIGLVGVTSLSAMPKSEGIKFIEPKTALRKTAQELKDQGVGLIILLSTLEESEVTALVKEIPGIDIVIMERGESKDGLYVNIGSTLFLKSSWQGRQLGKLSFSFKDDKIANYKVEALRVSEEVGEDPAVISILPRCFSDANCKKEGMIGLCQDSGSIKSGCVFTEATRLPFLIITPQVCTTCDSEGLIKALKRKFPGLIVSYLYYPGAKAEKLIKDFSITALPAYLFAKEIEKEKDFDNLKKNLSPKGEFYMLNPKVSGMSYFLERKKKPQTLDLFFSLYDKNAASLLTVTREFGPGVHFLAVKKGDGFEAANGRAEVEEYLRSVCVQKYYPEIFWDYISCRSKNADSSWWEDCFTGQDAQKIKACAKGNEGSGLLKKNTSLNKELEIMFGPTYLLDNQEVFSSRGVPEKEELKKILKR